jgi:hypothetical protein
MNYCTYTNDFVRWDIVDVTFQVFYVLKYQQDNYENVFSRAALA